jgi:hypothetical protein
MLLSYGLTTQAREEIRPRTYREALDGAVKIDVKSIQHGLGFYKQNRTWKLASLLAGRRRLGFTRL